MQTEIDRFFSETQSGFLEPFHQQLTSSLTAHHRHHGRTEQWDAVLASVTTDQRASSFNTDIVQVGNLDQPLHDALKAFMPWRKGPWQIGDTFVDTEWRSDWKWQRLRPWLAPLAGRKVLDIGCGNGYQLFRMLGEGAELALGVDPTILFNYQFALLQQLALPNQAYLLPLRGEHLPAFHRFDTVFSMGVLYHRRSPLEHLQELQSFLAPGGQLVLETLVVSGDRQTLLIPDDRYAKMANVWFIPSTSMLEIMLARVGFTDIKTVDVTRTTTDEQRSTPWMDFQSLADFLHPDNPAKTIEGYEAPTRAILTATKN